MAASNSNLEGAFLLYLTVFRSRLGIANIVLPLTGFAYLPVASLVNRLTAKLSEATPLELADPESGPVLRYLIEKKLIGQTPGRYSSRGRYKDYVLLFDDGVRAEHRSQGPVDRIPVFLSDVWMADPLLPSTIGVPTPENSREALDLCYQLGLISKTKNVWMAAGQLAARLRERFTDKATENPFVLGVEGVVLLRQILEKDGLMLRELLEQIRELREPFSRDDVAVMLPVAARRAYERTRATRLSGNLLLSTKKHVLGLEKYVANDSSGGRDRSKRTVAESVASKTPQRGPGVLEHRTAARLEWLVDLGVLTKEGEPRNAFMYRRSREFGSVCELMDKMLGQRGWADEVSLGIWRLSSRWAWARQLLPSLGERESLRLGYQIMRRVVGPASIREVSFAAALFERSQTLMPKALQEELVRWAAEDKKITLSGGVYTRSPELVHVADDLMGENAYGS
jgi:hypothetical protein